MKYYTSKGDAGTTKLFGCPQGVRLSKGESMFDLLGGLDELNSYVGLCRVVAERSGFCNLDGDARQNFLSALRSVQEDLFIIQAELAGSAVLLSEEKIKRLEAETVRFSTLFPAISSFVLPGATELSALFDIARTIARRVERKYVKGKCGPSHSYLGPYLNRLSSFLYVCARLATFAAGERERAPSYA